MVLKTSRFDAAEYLGSQAARDEFMLAAIETGDAAFVERARETVTRAAECQAALEAFEAVNRKDADILRALAKH